MDKRYWGGRGRRSFGSAADEPPGSTSGEGWLKDVMAEDRRVGARLTFVSPASGTAENLDLPGAPDRHSVHFYEADSGVVTAVAGEFERAIAGGERMLLVATSDHRAGIEAELQRRGARLDQHPYHAFDAAETLQSLLHHGAPDRQRFHEVVGTLVTKLAAEGPLSIYGEMVNLLWERGDVMAAMRLEGLWNELAAVTEFSLLCGYRAGGVRYGPLVERVSELHSHQLL